MSPGLTDLSWSPCGNILMASSSDGFCSIVTFSAGELGQPYIKQTNEEEKTVENQEKEKQEQEEKMETDNDLKLELEETQPQPEQPPASTQTNSEPSGAVAAPSDGKKRVPLVTLISGADNVRQGGGGGGATPEKPKGRRIELITLSSPKTKT